jgi:integrase
VSKPRYDRAANGVYYAYWSDGRRSKRASLGTREESEAWERFVEWRRTERETGDTPNQNTVEQLWTEYELKHVRTKVASPASFAYAWNNLRPHFGGLMPEAIDQNVVDEYERLRRLGKIGKPSVPVTIRRELATLRSCLNWCANPNRKILDPKNLPAFNLPDAGEPRDRWLRTHEVQALLTAAAAGRGEDGRLTRVERFLWLALETAARKTAIYQLTWDRVDFETGVIYYDVPGVRRTKKRRASVPISSTLRPVLERAYRERTNGLVLSSPSDLWIALQRVVERAGLGNGQKTTHLNAMKRTGISPHTLRHTAATHMARRGVPLWKIAGVLGNTMQMVEKVYAKHAPDGLADAVEAISFGLLEAAE